MRFSFLLWVALCATASATTMYSNLRAGQSYQDNPDSAGGSAAFSQGIQFQPGVTDSVAVILAPVSDSTGVSSFALFADNSGQPGTPLESWTNIAVPTSDSAIPLLALTSVLHPTLTSGSTYWFIALSGPGFQSWDVNSTGVSGERWVGPNPPTAMADLGEEDAELALEVDSATGTPEPGTMMTLGFAFAGMAALRIRTRRAL